MFQASNNLDHDFRSSDMTNPIFTSGTLRFAQGPLLFFDLLYSHKTHDIRESIISDKHFRKKPISITLGYLTRPKLPFVFECGLCARNASMTTPQFHHLFKDRVGLHVELQPNLTFHGIGKHFHMNLLLRRYVWCTGRGRVLLRWLGFSRGCVGQDILLRDFLRRHGDPAINRIWSGAKKEMEAVGGGWVDGWANGRGGGGRKGNRDFEMIAEVKRGGL